jgi:hypothetical protein
MQTMTPETTLDPRFSSEDATPTDWAAARDHLRDAKSYQLTTVRADGRPHQTTIAGVWVDEIFCDVCRAEPFRSGGDRSLRDRDGSVPVPIGFDHRHDPGAGSRPRDRDVAGDRLGQRLQRRRWEGTEAGMGYAGRAGHCCIPGSCVGPAYMGGQPRLVASGRSS